MGSTCLWYFRYFREPFVFFRCLWGFYMSTWMCFGCIWFLFCGYFGGIRGVFERYLGFLCVFVGDFFGYLSISGGRAYVPF